MRRFILMMVVFCGAVAADRAPAYPDFTLPDVINDFGTPVPFSPEAREAAVVHDLDVTGDGVPEKIVQLRSTDPDDGANGSFTMVFARGKEGYERVWTNVSGDFPGGLEFPDIDGDGIPEILIHETAGLHYHIICIVTHDPATGGYRKLFENGTPCALLDFTPGGRGQPATITVGRENWRNPEFCYANSDSLSFRQVWRWRQDAFDYDQDASTGPFLTEKEAAAHTVINFLQPLAASVKDDPATSRQYRRSYLLYMMGVRAYILFGPSLTLE